MPHCRGRLRHIHSHRAFTTIELMVVLGIIALILGIGLPAFNAMSRQADRTKARQMINSALTQAHVLSLSDRTLAAVRFAPAAWEQADAKANAVSGAQVAAIYQYKFSGVNADPTRWNTDNGEFVKFNERFERVDDLPLQTLPDDLWVAPSEALLDGRTDNSGFYGRAVLTGQPGEFEIDADVRNDKLLDADDFLVVFDPQTGVQAARWPSNFTPGDRRSPWQLRAYNPNVGYETAWDVGSDGVPNTPLRAFRRFNFTGVVLYDREQFLAVGNQPARRQDFLKDHGEVYHVDRLGGGLIPGGRQVQ